MAAELSENLDHPAVQLMARMAGEPPAEPTPELSANSAAEQAAGLVELLASNPNLQSELLSFRRLLTHELSQ